MKKVALLLTIAAAAVGQESWDKLNEQVESLYTEGNLPVAMETAHRALSIAASPAQRAHSLERIGFLEFTLGDSKTAEKHLRESLESWGLAGRDNTGYAEALFSLALLLRDTSRGQEAISLAQEGAALRKRLLGDLHVLTADAFNVLGSIYATLGDYDQARLSYEQSLAMHAAQGVPNQAYGTLCAQLGQLYQRLGEYDKARVTLDNGLTMLAKSPGKSHPAYSITLSAYAFLLQDLGLYVEAERTYAESLRLLEAQFPAEHPAIANVLNNQGVLAMMMGNLAVAESSLRRSLAMKEKLNQPTVTVSTLRNLGRIVAERDAEEAEKMYSRAIGLIEKAPSQPAYELASALVSLGDAQRKRNDLSAALNTLQRALQVTEKAFGRLHPLYATASRHLGEVHQALGNLFEAEHHYRRALDAVTRSKGPDHPDMVKPLQVMARLHRERGDLGAAYSLFRQSGTILSQVYTQAMSMGSVAAKSTMIANLGDPVPELIDFQQRAAQLIPESRDLAMEAVTMRKARVLEYVRNWREDVRRNASVDTRKRLDKWQAFVDCRAAISVALEYRELRAPAVGSCGLEGTEFAGRYARMVHELRTSWTSAQGEQALKALAELNSQLANLEEGLARDVVPLRSLLRNTGVKDMQGRLGPDELLLEFVLFQPYGSAGTAAHYGVFLLDAAGSPDWVDIGPAAPIDRAVRDLLQSANDWATSLAGGEPGAARSARLMADHAADLLSRELLAPVLLKVAGHARVRHLRIAPDGLLTLLPFEALTMGGTYLLEQFAVSYLSAGRDLVDLMVADQAAGPAVIAVSPGPVSRPGTAGHRTPFRAETLDPLPGAREEARSLQAYLPGAQLLGEGQATEEAIKRVRNPAVFHVIGHGVVRNREECAATSQNCLAEKDPAARAMSLSAIVFEEAYGRGKGSSQDGLLTALELQNVDLSGTSLLVLSQCRMADGVPTSSDGVYGMRRAAALAGARSLIAPLWKIADRAQTSVIHRFYQGLSQGRGRAEALRNAKLSLLKTKQYRHPLYWSPLILAGDAGPLPPGLLQAQ